MKKIFITIGLLLVSFLGLYFFNEHRTRQAEALIDAANIGDVERMKTLVHSGVNPDGVAYDGLTPIVAATQRHQYAAINYLLSVGVDINKGDENRLTALFYAALQNDEAMYDFVLAKGAALHFPDKLREKYLRDVVAASKNKSLIEKVDLQISKESAPKK